MIACRTSSSLNRVTRVSTASRSAGGVSRFEIARTPNSDMCSVRGIGVAVIVSTSTVAAQRLEPLLHLDAKPLLLINDQEAKVLKLHVGRRHPMRADQNIELTRSPPAR